MAEQLGTGAVVGGEVGPSTDALIFVLDLGGLAGSRGCCGMEAMTRLHGVLLVGRDDEIGLVQGMSCPKRW